MEEYGFQKNKKEKNGTKYTVPVLGLVSTLFHIIIRITQTV